MDQLAPAVSLVRTRRSFTREFKARVVEACKEPGSSVASVAQNYQLNANLVHRWRRQFEEQDAKHFIPLPAKTLPSKTAAEKPDRTVRIELPNGVVVHWPEDRILESALWIKALRP